MNRKLRALSLLGLALLSGGITKAQTEIIGITEDDRVFRIANATMPANTTTPMAITGLATGQTVAGADYRPNTGQLYIMGYAAASNTAQLYVLNPSTGVATAVGSTATLMLGTGSIGFDFNPTVDRIRVVGANGKNYRLHPLTGAIAAIDADLNFAPGDINSGQIPAIGAVAYTNSYIGSEATTLYNYDQVRNILTSQVPPNNGTLNTIGSSGIMLNMVNSSADMDIYFNPSTGTNTAYLAANVLASTNDNLYTINTTTGMATLVGTIGTGIAVKNIAVVTDRSMPATVTGNLIYALTRTNKNLISFDSDLPGTIRSLTAVSGITAGYTLVGMDYRPATRTLYAMAYSHAMTSYQLYIIDPVSGAATAVNTAPFTMVLDSTSVGFDFNPTVDRIRVTSANGRNYRLNPDNGAIAATDSNLAYNIGDVREGVRPNIGTVAYTNSYMGATTTTLYAIDDSLAALTTIAPPNNGRINTITGNILPFNLADRSTDLDIFFDSTSMTNIGYLAANVTGSDNDNLYVISTTGSISAPARIGNGIPIADIAVVLRYTGSPLSVPQVAAGALPLTVFPNPAHHAITVKVQPGQGAISRMIITDLYGRTVKEVTATNGQQVTTGIEAFAPGNYLIRVTMETGATGTYKILKQ